jgi:hypothetical protein
VDEAGVAVRHSPSLPCSARTETVSAAPKPERRPPPCAPRPPRRRRADEHRPAPPPSCSALAEAAAHAAGGAPTPESKPPLPLLLPPLSPLYLSELSLEPKSLAPPPHCSVSPLAQAAAVEAIAALPLARRPALCSVQLPLSPLPRLPSAPPQHEPRRIALA